MGRLVISRRPGERIKIGSDIVVEFINYDRGKARLAIQAPDTVKVLREELLPGKNGPDVGPKHCV